MDKLSIQISPGISAFVGPNGCGKSNIVDAIRWVMGEQSPKQLRGRQMEDLIFSGAGALKPLGMAEVRLTLQNGAGPHDNGEISIGRRLYRSGESEYLINNSQCRLKDIHDLFMDTGLGNRTYSVIAQGEISSVIEQRPEETRLLLEEAAGISKYKARREASLKKISLTKENLRRVEDLLAEISREMNSLKRQAGKARRYKEVSSEIRRLNLVLLAYTYDELQKEKLDIKRLIDDKMKKKEELESLFSESEVIIEEKNLELIGKEKLLTFLRESVFSHRETCRKNEDALQHLAADQERFRQADIRLNKEKEEIGGKLRGFESEINQISSKIGVLGESVQEISSLRSDYDSSFKEQRLLLSRIRDGLEKEKSHLIELTTNEARLTGEIRNLTEVTNHLDTRKDELEKSSKESAQRLEKVTVLLHEKKKEREEVLIQVKSLEKELQKQKIRLLEIEEVKGEKESKRISADSELRLLRSQLKTIRELIESYEGYNSGVRKIMKIYGQKTVKERKILGLLADFIQVEPEFETAVEAVLEDKLQYVIVSKQEHGKEAVEYLRSTNEGRSYFLPIEEFKPEKYPDKGKDKLNGFRLLKDHVSVTEKLKPVVESFLGNAALVENLSQALSAWNNYKGNQILVTPEGDLVDKRGIIIGGRLGEDSIGLLRRRRKEHELGKKIDDQEKLIAISKSELEDIDMNIQEIQNCIDELERNKTAYAQKADKIERDMLFLENDAEQLKRVFQSIADQIGSLGNEKQENKSRLIDLEKRLSERCKERK